MKTYSISLSWSW